MSAVITPSFRVSYPNVFKARKNDLSGNDEYSLVALFKKGEDLSSLKELVESALADKWPDKAKRPKNLRIPFRDQAEREKDGILPEGYEEGAVMINLKSKQRPGVVDESAQAIIDESLFYPGCYARASIAAYAYDTKGNRGVAFGLRNVQKTGEGEPFSGKVKAEDEFAPIESSSDLDSLMK